MKILIIGRGIIGTAVKKSLAAENEVLTADCIDGGDVQVDISSPESIKAMFKAVGKVDAIISAAGHANMAPFNQLTDADYELAINNKLMGQINLVRIGQEYINKGGSITLTAGLASRNPAPGLATISMTSVALEIFVRSAALELDSISHKRNLYEKRRCLFCKN